MGTPKNEKKDMNTLTIGTAVIRLLAPLLLLASVFPYIQIVPSESYSQLYVFIFGFILFFFSFGIISYLRRSDQFAILSLSVVGVILFIITCFPYDNYNEYRYLLAYVTPLIMVPVFIKVFQIIPKETVWILQGSILVWLLASTVQFLVNPQFATLLLGHWGNSATDIILSGRGVLGLAPEPTHNAFHTLLLGVVLSLLDNRKFSRLLLFGCLTSALFLAASSSALLILFFVTFIWFLRYKPLWLLIIVTTLLIFLEPVLFMFQKILDENTRLIILLKLFLENPINFLTTDYSVNVRLGGLWVTLNEAIQFGLFPHGLSYDTWLQTRIKNLATHDWLIELSLSGPPSGVGLLLFQGGALTLPFLVIFMCRLFKSKISSMIGNIFIMAVPLIFLSQFYISSPLFSMIYACILYQDHLKHITQQKKYPSEHTHPVPKTPN